MRESRLPWCNDTTYPGRFPDIATLAAHSSLRAIHSRGHYPWRIKDNAAKPDRWCAPVDAAEPWGTSRDSVMTPRHTERQGILGRSCPKNRWLFQAINGYCAVVIPVLEYCPAKTTITSAFRSRVAVLMDGYPFVVTLHNPLRILQIRAAYSASVFQIASIFAFVSSSMRISSGHGRANPSDAHFRVASIPIFDP